MCGSDVTFEEMLFGYRKLEISLFDAVTTLEQPLCAGEPSHGLCRLTPKEQAETSPESTARCTDFVVGGKVSLVGTFEYVHELVVAAEQICRDRQQLEIVGAKRGCLIRKQEGPVRIRPCPASVAIATLF